MSEFPLIAIVVGYICIGAFIAGIFNNNFVSTAQSAIIVIFWPLTLACTFIYILVYLPHKLGKFIASKFVK